FLLNLAQEGDPGQQLTQPVVQILPNTQLLSGAVFEYRLLQTAALGKIEGAANHERHAIRETMSPFVAGNHLGFTVKPNYAVLARDQPVGGPQRLPPLQHGAILDTESLPVVGMNLFIPTDRMLQPFLFE